MLPRRADTTAVIGSALLASANGTGYRRIAAELARPPATVRGWIAAVRGAHAEWLRSQALHYLARIDRDAIATLAVTDTRLGDALDAVAAAALRVRVVYAPGAAVWTVVTAVTRWLLPSPAG